MRTRTLWRTLLLTAGVALVPAFAGAQEAEGDFGKYTLPVPSLLLSRFQDYSQNGWFSPGFTPKGNGDHALLDPVSRLPRLQDYLENGAFSSGGTWEKPGLYALSDTVFALPRLPDCLENGASSVAGVPETAATCAL